MNMNMNRMYIDAASIGCLICRCSVLFCSIHTSFYCSISFLCFILIEVSGNTCSETIREDTQKTLVCLLLFLYNLFLVRYNFPFKCQSIGSIFTSRSIVELVTAFKQRKTRVCAHKIENLAQVF